MFRRSVAALPVALGVLVIAGASPAWATAPGANGRLAFTSTPPKKSKAKVYPAASLTSLFVGAPSVTVAPKKPLSVSAPEYSADGTKIAFLLSGTGAETKRDGLYVADFSGANPKQLARTSWTDGIAWSPDGKTLVYTDVMDGLHAVPVAGGKSKLIVPVQGDGGFYRRPTFSPDGASIVFERDTLSDNADGKPPWLEIVELWRANPDGSGAAPLFAQAPVKFAGEPDFSPDGKSLVFDGPLDKYGKRWALHTAALDGSGLRTLYTAPKGRWIDGPTWSPDGTRIAFATGGSLKQGASVLSIDPATAATATIASAAKGELGQPTWQPLNAAPAQ